MHRALFLIASLFGLGLVGCAGPRPGEQADRRLDPEKLERRLERLRTRWQIPGMSAAVARDGAIVWQRGFGQADAETHRPATPDTVYHLASLTKPFAATVVLQLVQEGRLSLDTPVERFGIQLKGRGAIRVRHLLAHTSEAVPGETYRYNGSRFGQLDKVIERVTGRTFAAEVSRRILGPLELASTSPNPERLTDCQAANRRATDFRGRLAQGYSQDGRRPVAYKGRFGTAAGMVSTVGDTLRFSAALDRGDLLRPEMHRLMVTPAVNSRGHRQPYGLGWFVQTWRGRELLWHYGWWDGCSSLIVSLPQERVSFVVLANSDGLSREFHLGKDEEVRRSPFARAFLAMGRP